MSSLFHTSGSEGAVGGNPQGDPTFRPAVRGSQTPAFQPAVRAANEIHTYWLPECAPVIHPTFSQPMKGGCLGPQGGRGESPGVWNPLRFRP